jgi:hypothetical protein
LHSQPFDLGYGYAVQQVKVPLDSLCNDQRYLASVDDRVSAAGILFLVVCGTIAGDDCDDFVDWGEAHLSFLRDLRTSITPFGAPIGYPRS